MGPFWIFADGFDFIKRDELIASSDEKSFREGQTTFKIAI